MRKLIISLFISIFYCGSINAASSDDSKKPIFFNALDVDEARIIQADQEPQNWLAHGRTYDEQRFSPLTDINRSNIADLELAWAYETGTKRGLEATPIVVNGIIYTTGSWSKVYAVDAISGKEIWRYDPKVPGATGRKACCDVVNRGVALWKGKLYLGTLDGRLIALDAKDGKLLWEVVTVDQSKAYTITGAPRVVRGKVIIGNGGAEFGVRGYFSAYNAETGELEWRFYTVPSAPGTPVENPELLLAQTTWSKDSLWETGLGGTVWDSFAYDPELNLLYVGVGNSSQYNRKQRSPGGGDNLYLASILAVNPDTGRLVWHYQTTPGEHWDYTATQHMILAELTINDKPRKVLMQAPKNGFFYVIDRETGELISAEKYTPMNWASHVDLETGKPVETGKADWTEETAFVMPGPTGGHNWHPMSFSPKTKLVYIPTIEGVYPFIPDKDYKFVAGEMNTGEDFVKLGREAESSVGILKTCSPNQLTAWNPVTQEQVWQVRFDAKSNGGVLSTAGGLVFQGNGSGKFTAYADDSGEVLWSAQAPTTIMAPPVTYKVGGEQYILVMAGAGGSFGMVYESIPYINKGHMLAFKLKGQATMPPMLPKKPGVVAEVSKLDTTQIEEGRDLYNQYCMRCHGVGAKSTGIVPDLRFATKQTHEAWSAIVIGGTLRDKGMDSFANVIDIDEASKIHSYVIHRALREPSVLDRVISTIAPHICIPPALLAN